MALGIPKKNDIVTLFHSMFYLSYIRPCLRDFQLASDRLLFYLVIYQVERPSFVGVEGSVVELRVTVTGNPPPDVYWRKGPVRDIDTTRGRFRILGDGSLQVRSNLSSHCFASHETSLSKAY